MNVPAIPEPSESLDAPALAARVREQQRVLEQLQAQIRQYEQAIAQSTALVREKDATIARLTHEIAVLRRLRFGKKSEQLGSAQLSLLEETVAEDIAAIEQELEQLRETPRTQAQPATARRQPLPPELPRVEIRHEPEAPQCGCGQPLERIGEDVTEKLDYTPGVFTVQRHIRGKWVCRCCEKLVQAPVPAHVIDKGIPTPGLLAQVLVAKYAEHLPLYRQQRIFERAGVSVPVSSLADWVGASGVALQPLADALREVILAQPVLHADETPIQVLRPETGTKPHRAYLWAYAPSAFDTLKAVVYDFTPGRSGEHARAFLGKWRGKLIVDDYVGYKKVLAAVGVTEIGCWAHARRKFHDLHAASGSPVAEQALAYIGELYAIEREVKALDAEERWRIRQQRAKPLLEKLHAWMQAQRARVPEGSGIARALDYSLKRWDALMRYADDGRVSIDNNYIEQQIRPLALGRRNWLFAGSLRAGRRAAAIMSLLHSARLNGHDPYAYLKDVLTRLPTHPHSRIEELLPHNWRPANA